MNWFSVDKAGLAAILERRGKVFALFELVQNAWDSNATMVDIRLEPIAGQPYATLTIDDDGDGFADLSHANTMFARSLRAADPEKRGRFNLGEKLVLAVCRKARISTTTGTLSFEDDGSVKRASRTRARGTEFTGEIRMTRDEYAEVCDAMRRLLPPVRTVFNGKELDRPDSLCTFTVKLPTEIADPDGQIRRTVRTATVEVYEGVEGGEVLEMGIPIVATENGYRVNVMQKIPLNLDRDNVQPSFLRAVNAAVLNNMHSELSAEAAAQPWAQEAAGDARATPQAIKSVITKRFGERAVVATVGDPVANAQAEAAGFTVIPGGALSGDIWANIRKHNMLTAASKAFPTPSPESLAESAKTRCPVCGK